jgi:adenine-specific DNA-methyltransferase
MRANSPTTSPPPREGASPKIGAPQVDFAQIVIDYLKTAGIQSDKRDRIVFDSVTPWRGHWIGAEGRFRERDETRPDLTAAAREAIEAGFDLLIACAFNFDATGAEDRGAPGRGARG